MQSYPAAYQGGDLEALIADRARTDYIMDPGMSILLSFVTCGIYGWYVVYKLVQRRDEHLRRMAAVADASIRRLREKAQGREELVSQELAELEQLKMQMLAGSTERGAALWLVIAMLTGIGSFILYYLLMQDYVQHDQLEARFFTVMSSALAKLGLAAQPGQAVPSVPQREPVTFILLTIFTCGIYGLYWMYVMIKDFNDHFTAQVPWENFLWEALR
mgnify:CR=1 FL=1